jgi:hypothetical protein
MPGSTSHPPKPVLCYRLGIAGTTDLTDADLGLPDRIGKFLDFLKNRVHAIWKENPAYFNAQESPRLILICSLAKGVDLLVARLARERGYELQVPLAFNATTYAQMNFGEADVEDKASFDELLKAATARLELDGDPSQPDAAYDISGSILVNNSDALLAIWNFGPGKGPGGTADSFDKAKKTGLLVARMRPDRPEGPFFHEDGMDRSFEELKPQLHRQLLPGLIPGDPTLDTDPDTLRRVSREQARLKRFYGEREWRFDFGWPYNITTAVLSLSKRSLKRRLPSYREMAGEFWPVTDETFTDRARAHFKPIDQWADGLAVFYANCTRSTVVVLLLPGAVLLAYGLGTKLWPGAGQNQGFPALEGVAILLLTALAIFARWRGVHPRWLQYRMLSEFLRSAALASAIGGLALPQTRFHDSDTVSHTWISFYFQAAVRSMGLLNASFDDKYLENFKELLIARLNGQIDFHRKRGALYRKIDQNIRRCGYFIFGVSFVGAGVQIVTGFMPPGGEPIWRILLHHLANLSLLLPVFGAALAAFVSQESFGRLAHLSATITRRLQNILRQVVHAPLKSEVLREMTSVAIDEMMGEHEEWFVLYSLRDIELPH